MPSGQVVRHTRCIGVPGFPSLLAAALASLDSPWHPEYTVYEEYRDLNQGQYLCEVRILTLDGNAYPPQHYAQGVGTSVNMAVQDAARHALTLLRDSYPDFEDNPFRYFPSSEATLEGCFSHTYADPSQEQDPRLRCTADATAAYARRERELYQLTVTLADRLRRLTDNVRPYVRSGSVPSSVLQQSPIVMSPLVASPEVGGTVPPRGRIRLTPDVGGIPQSPHDRQPENVRRFPGPPVHLPVDFGGY